MKRAVLLFGLFFLFGCGSQLRAVMPTLEKLDSYNIGQPQQKTVGDTIVFDMDARWTPGFVAKGEYQIPGVLLTSYPKITPGMECAVIGTLENGDMVCSLSASPSVVGTGTVNWAFCLIFNGAGEAYGDSACYMVNVREWSEKPAAGIFKPTKFFQQGSFKRELIYNGKSKETIKLQYREYKDSLARPAFYQDLIYDLSESKEIGFMGMQIEVLEATNSFIKFIVKSKMN